MKSENRIKIIIDKESISILSYTLYLILGIIGLITIIKIKRLKRWEKIKLLSVVFVIRSLITQNNYLLLKVNIHD